MQTTTSRGLVLKTAASDSASSPTPNPINDRRLPPPEKKRPVKPEAQLQEDLKRTKERRALQEAEEVKKQLTAMAAELVESQNQLKEFSEQEWQSEMEPFHKHYSMAEIKKLRMQLDRVTKSQAAQARHAESEIQSLRVELTETLILVDRLKTQLNEYESYALDEVRRAEKQLEVVKTAENKLKLEHDNDVQQYNSLLLDLDKSNSRVKSLEEVVATLQSDLANISANSSAENGEVDEMKSALGDAERRYIDEYIQSTIEIQNAYQLVELTRSESSEREAQVDAKLRDSRAQVEELRIKLVEKENAVQITSKLKEEADDGVREAKLELEVLKTSLQATSEENEKLRRKMLKTEIERRKALELVESSRDAEHEALLRLDSLADKSCKKVERVTEQLDASQASNAELEAELLRLKVQCHQWKKAAEAAAAMLSTNKYGERRGSLDYHTITSRLSSAQSDDEDDDSPKKKNRNMLKKIGVLLKKGHK
ncbi:hypothetical protein AAHA92_22543 [Salvia divinorum]|uniref:Interactor of constitutive active ROPs 2, chloroplastic n=1 Tax=Salvia divinorum TaxID=28513 RepID=A0ABD1GP04_SALDI